MLSILKNSLTSIFFRTVPGRQKQFTIRSATTKDIQAICCVHVQSWKEAYKDIIDTEYLEKMKAEDRVHSWEKALCKKDVFNFVAVNLKSEIIGFVSGGQERETSSQVGEIYAIYVLEKEQGLGVGRALWNTSCTFLKKKGYSRAIIWVLEDNKNAIDFYIRNSCFFTEKKKQIRLGNTNYNELCFEWRL